MCLCRAWAPLTPPCSLCSCCQRFGQVWGTERESAPEHPGAAAEVSGADRGNVIPWKYSDFLQTASSHQAEVVNPSLGSGEKASSTFPARLEGAGRKDHKEVRDGITHGDM